MSRDDCSLIWDDLVLLAESLPILSKTSVVTLLLKSMFRFLMFFGLSSSKLEYPDCWFKKADTRLTFWFRLKHLKDCCWDRDLSPESSCLRSKFLLECRLLFTGNCLYWVLAFWSYLKKEGLRSHKTFDLKPPCFTIFADDCRPGFDLTVPGPELSNGVWRETLCESIWIPLDSLVFLSKGLALTSVPLTRIGLLTVPVTEPLIRKFWIPLTTC